MTLAIRKKACIPTERLVLRPYEAADVERLCALLTDERITGTFLVPKFQSKAEAIALAERLVGFSALEDTVHLEYGIVLGGELIGFVNDCGIEEDTIEIGYVVDPAYWGKGYATEAVRAVLRELKEMGFRKVTAGFFEENPASRKVMKKCGMTPAGLMEEEEYRGEIHRCFYYELCF